MKKLISYTFFFLIIYLLYVYPFDVLIYLISNEELFKISSFFLAFVFYIIIFYFFKSYNTLFPLRLFVYEGMGIGFISFWITNIGLLISNFSLIESHDIGIGCFFFIIIIVFFSLINAGKVQVKKIEINSSKIKKKTQLIFLSDIHLGTNSKKHLEKIYFKIKGVKFDFIIVGGDLIDSSSFKLDGLEILKNIKKPIFFISGNHEYYIKDYKKKLCKLRQYNITYLNNISHKFNDINIIGISDNQKIIDQIKTANKLFKKNSFNLITVHKPTLWNSVYEQTDLMLSGHTHNGQIFPFNFFVKFQFKNIYGIYKNLHSKLYVSSGSGCWGPKMRLGTKNEIVHFTIK